MKNTVIRLTCILLGTLTLSYTFSSASIPLIEDFFDRLPVDSELGNDLEWTVESDGLSITNKKQAIWWIQTEEQFIIIFHPPVVSWPGNNSVTVVLTDENMDVIDWTLSGGQSIFEWAYINKSEEVTELKIVSRRRGVSDVPDVTTFIVEDSKLRFVSSKIDDDLRIGRRIR